MKAAGYPEAPGWRRGPNSETSQDAARVAGQNAGPLKEQVLALIGERPASPEELVIRFRERGATVLLNTIRARCSDLHALGKLQPSGSYGRGESGKVRVIRWRLATPDELSLALARKAARAEKEGSE